MNEIKTMLAAHGITQAELSRRFNIPLRTVEDWCAGRRTPPPYVLSMLNQLLVNEKIKEEKLMCENYIRYLEAASSQACKNIESLSVHIPGSSVILRGKAAAAYLMDAVVVETLCDEDGNQYRVYVSHGMEKDYNADCTEFTELYAPYVSEEALPSKLEKFYDYLCDPANIYVNHRVCCSPSTSEDPGKLSIRVFPESPDIDVDCSEWVEYANGDIDDIMYDYATTALSLGETVDTAAQRVVDRNRQAILYAIAEASILSCGDEKYLLPIGPDLVNALLQEAESHLLDPLPILREAAQRTVGDDDE